MRTNLSVADLGDLLDRPLLATLATYRRSGELLLSPVWFEWLANEQPAEQITSALWSACHGGQRATAELLLQHGADVNWVAPRDGLTSLDAAGRSNADQLAAWLVERGAQPSGNQKPA